MPRPESSESASSLLPTHWVGFREVGAVSSLLVARFGRRRRMARWRYAMKLLLTPHLSIGSVAVIGIVPSSRVLRCWWAFLWLIFGQGRALNKATFPRPLAPVPTEWRVINFASSPTRSGVGTAMALSRLMLAVADAQTLVLRADTRLEDPRLERAYARHGFVRTSTGFEPGSETVEMIRRPQTVIRKTRGRIILRSGRTNRAYARAVFGDDWEHLGGRLLDLGAGDSPLARELQDRGWHTVRLDRDYAALPPARRDGAVAGDCAALPFADNSFDVVVAVWVLLHVDDVHTCVREIARVLRPSGVLLLHPLWGSRARIRRLTALPGVRVRSGGVSRDRPCARVDAAAMRHWDPDQLAEFEDAVRPGRVIRALGQLAANLIVRTTRDHRFGSFAAGEP